MKISAKHIIGVSVAVTLFAGGVVPNANARTQTPPCPDFACPTVFDEGDCSAIGPNALCQNVADNNYPGCVRSLQFAMCSSFANCAGGLGALCYWS